LARIKKHRKSHKNKEKDKKTWLRKKIQNDKKTWLEKKNQILVRKKTKKKTKKLS
jgi:hypothetical protein